MLTHLNSLSHSIVSWVTAGPGKKIDRWAHYWDDPTHIAQARWVVIGTILLFIALTVINRLTSKKKRR